MICALVSISAPVSPVTSAHEGWESAVTAETQALIEGLSEFVEWCGSERLYATRAQVCEVLILLEPDHVDARRALGYRRKRDTWELRGDVKTPTDADEAAVMEAEGRYADVVRPYCRALHALIDSGEHEPEVERIRERILLLDPDDTRVHESLGETRVENRWVLEETARGIEERVRIEGIVHDALENAALVEPIEPTDEERGYGSDYHAVRCGRVRVLSTHSLAEASDLARALVATETVFERLFDQGATLPSRLTVYLMGPEEGDRFLAAFPRIDDAQRAEYRQLEGLGLTNTEWAFWKGDRQKLIDGAVRLAFNYLMARGFGITLEQGWASEGVGLYLTKALVGSRRTWYIDTAAGLDPREAFAKRSRLLDPRTNWIAEGHDLLEQGGSNLTTLFEKPSHALSVDDLLIANAVTAFMLEAFPERAKGMLERAATAPPPTTGDLFGMEPSALAARLERWMRESFAAELDPPITAANLLAQWNPLDEDLRRLVVERFLSRLKTLKNPQLETIEELVASVATERDGWGPPVRPDYYDPKKHAPSQPIRRKWLDEDSYDVLAVQDEMIPTRRPGDPVLAYEYDWGRQEIVVVGDPDDVETIFRNAANGFPPGLDIARAVALRTLDRGDHRVEQVAFSHAYTDREGGVYPGVTLYDAWRSGVLIEMPDVDVLGIIHDVDDDWTTWVAPIPGSEHERLYAYVGRMYRIVHDYRVLREELALHLLVGEPRGAYDPTRTNLHAFWADSRSDPKRAARKLPDGHSTDRWVRELVDECLADPGYYDEGGQREGALVDAAADLRQLLAGLLAEASSGD